jgi:hypothetical protein
MTSAVVRHPIVEHANWLEYVLRIAAEASTTPAPGQGKSPTHARRCGEQRAHQWMITDDFRPCPRRCAATLRGPHNSRRLDTLVLLTTGIRGLGTGRCGELGG